MPRSLSIAVEGIELRGRCGVSDEERAVGQTLVVDVAWSPPTAPARRSDDLAGTVNYSRVVDLVRGIVTERRVQAAGAPRHRDRWTRCGTSSRLAAAEVAGGQGRAAAWPSRWPWRGSTVTALFLMEPQGPWPRRAFVSLGSNLGERAAVLARRARRAGGAARHPVVAASGHLRDGAPGRPDQPPFLNQVVVVDTGLEPLDLLHECQRIETRARTAPRPSALGRARWMSIYCSFRMWSPTTRSSRCRIRAWQRVRSCSCRSQEIWSLARGMPDVDVAGLAAKLRREARPSAPYVAED